MRQFFVPVLITLLLGACSDERTVEQQIIAAVTEMETLAEEGRRGDFMDRVHVDFKGQQGGLTRDEFRRYMVMQWNRNQRLHAQLFPIRVQELDPVRASARFRALITGGRGMLPERGELYEISTIWVRDGRDWLLEQAEWEPVRIDSGR